MIPTLLLLHLATVLSSSIGRPHVIQILLDDWGYGDIQPLSGGPGSGGPGSTPRTPNINRLVQSGTLFTHWHSGSPVCSPSRLALMTSRFPAELKFHTALDNSHANNAALGCADFLPLDTPFLPGLLTQFGNYSTAHYGKWHLGSTQAPYTAPCPAAYGFPEANATVTYVSNPNCPTLGNFSDPWWPSNSSRWIVDLGIAHATRALADKRSFYMNLNFHISHAPLLPTEEQLKNFSAVTNCAWSGMIPDPQFFGGRCPMQTFRASQHAADAEIGRLLDWLISQNIEDDTIIVRMCAFLLCLSFPANV